MELIYYRGLNCHLACVMSIARALGAEYRLAYAALWSETDFFDDAQYHIYTSRRVLTGLYALGIGLEVGTPLGLGEELCEGELFALGLDSFYIPWHPVYQTAHDFHYSFAQKISSTSYVCYDPLYDAGETALPPERLFPHAYEQIRVRRLAARRDPPVTLRQEAEAVRRGHPALGAALSAALNACAGDGKGGLPVLIKQITAMINNRYLFRHYLTAVHPPHAALFDEAFYRRWDAVRNGLYKAGIVRENREVTEETGRLLRGLLEQETAMAAMMAGD